MGGAIAFGICVFIICFVITEASLYVLIFAIVPRIRFGFRLAMVALYREAYRLYRRTEDSLYRGLSMGMVAGLTGLLVHAVGANTFIIVRIMEPFWLTAGLIVAAAKLEQEQSARAVDG